ncbi:MULTISPECIES: hypothetical protein [Paeniglutamicibacter]|uniref:DUF4352 domain-containing protein n=1 Tax=Paeniglutamicibacter terrestris TaxID=2723403 RepID=A0ABX1G1M9_9MICC|nr:MULTISPECIES: hypothetical protein [Paeniglutamicibacter]NKG19367.1 hypothetical protein [Paeniglutamicibacter terrestris]QXQ09596.1 hypothetical protein KUF55_14155 [Paeniglutamicibacter sp. Y32M11]
MNHKFLAVASLATLLLTGCADTNQAPTAPDVTPIASGSPSSASTEPSAATPSATAETSDRGNLIKVIGQPAGTVNTAGDQTVSFVVKKIDMKIKCNAPYATKAENGHLIGIKMDVQTFKELNDPDYPGMTFDAHPSSWTFISKEGTTFNGDLGTSSAFMCLEDDDQLPNSIGPAQKATGWIVLDVPATTGTLIFSTQPGTGWEWELAEGPNA